MGYQTTPERRANLVKLARFLYTEPIEPRQFRMSGYCTTSAVYAVTIPKHCGTAGCAVGWGPSAGIAPDGPNEDWGDYCDRAFSDGDNVFWSWCFDCDWNENDNTPKGAAKRILWALLNGVPIEGDIIDMLNGDEPLIYADWEPTDADWQKAALHV